MHALRDLFNLAESLRIFPIPFLTADYTDGTDKKEAIFRHFLIRAIRVIRGKNEDEGKVLMLGGRLVLCVPGLSFRAFNGRISMSITVDLSEREIADVKKMTQQQDASAAVRLAAVEYIRYIKRKRLQALSGQVQMDDTGNG